MIKVIIFDMDGVLVHNQRKFGAMFAEKCGISLEKVRPFFDGPFQNCLIGGADLKEAVSPFLSAWGWDRGEDAFLDIWFQAQHDINKELVEYVQELRRKGILCILATNNEKYRFQYILDKTGFADVFDKTYSSAHLGHKKPNQEFFEKIAKDLTNIRKEEILFWDDDVKNIEGAKSFGINAEFYTDAENFHEKMRLYGVFSEKPIEIQKIKPV